MKRKLVMQKPVKQDRYDFEDVKEEIIEYSHNGTFQSGSEIIAADYLRSEGYGVLKTHHRKDYAAGKYSSEIKRIVEDEIEGGFRQAGIPDLLVFDLSIFEEKLDEASINNIRHRQYSTGLFLEVFVSDLEIEDLDYFFVEVKSEDGTLSSNQREWIENNPEQEVKIIRFCQHE